VEYARLEGRNAVGEFSADPGTYDILAVARAGTTTNAGLYGVSIANVSGGVPLYSDSVAVGELEAGEALQLPSDATYTLTLADLGFPGALATVGAVLTRGQSVLVNRATVGTSSFNATAGEAELYAFPIAAAQPAAGVQLVSIERGAEQWYTRPFTAVTDDASGALKVVVDEVNITSAGSYRATLTDFDFPGALASLEMAVVRDETIVGRRTGPGPVDFPGVAGPVLVLVAAQPMAAVGSGLYGVQVAREPSGPLVHDTTQAVGALFRSHPVDVTVAGSYDLNLADLQFPVAFAELGLAITRGTRRVGFVFGGGGFSFDATPGRYYVNVIARTNAATGFGTYGLEVETTPPAPVVTLTANPDSVASGASSSLTWSAANATDCTASGGWSGARNTSGSETVGPLTADSTFTLTCRGPGGSDAETATVRIRVSKSGGGAIHGQELLPLLLLLGLRRRRPGNG